MLGAGDRIEVVDRPGHGVTIGLFAEAYLGDRSRLVRVARGRRALAMSGAHGSTSGRETPTRR